MKGCKHCGSPWHYRAFCPHKKRKPIKQKGKKTLAYEVWRDEVAKPYLDMTFGYQCAECGATTHLDVDHIKTRGSRPDLKMRLDNVQYLCRSCHIKKTNGG